jgi:hypothetical protein
LILMILVSSPQVLVAQDLRTLLTAPARADSLALPPLDQDALGRLQRYHFCLDQDLGVGPLRRFYHLVDVDGDGVNEVIFSGPNFGLQRCYPAEGDQTVLFSQEGDSLHEIFRDESLLLEYQPPAAGRGAQLTLRRRGCCGWFVTSWAFVTIAGSGKTSRARASEVIETTWMTLDNLPTRWFDKPRAFVVDADRHDLRFQPAIDDTSSTPLNQVVDRPGNVVAEFGRGARGMAYGEHTEPSGRVWWLVLMEPAHARWVASEPARLDWPAPKRLGWMSSRSLRPR